MPTQVTVYLDKERLKTGENWEDGFCDGLKKSEIYMPLVSHGFLGPMCARGDKKGLDPTPAGRRRLDPNMWPICYLPGIYNLIGHDAEDNCLKEVQLAQHLMHTPPDQKEGDSIPWTVYPQQPRTLETTHSILELAFLAENHKNRKP